MDIKPCPEQIDMCDPQNVVFGFPITNEWFFGLYDVMKRERQVREASQEFLSLVSMMGEICQSMYPEWGHISPVVVAAGNYGACTLIRIGMHGWTPPRRVIVDMAKELRKYGLVEKPGWFPGIGLKSACYISIVMVVADLGVFRRVLIVT